MENKNIDKLKSISFPNTVAENERSYYTSKGEYSFKGIMKSGEMAGVQWIQVWKYEKLVAEIKESVCDLYYKE